MKNKFLPIIAIMAIAAFFIGMYTQDPTSSRTPNIQPLNVHDPIVPQTNAVVKFVDSLNGANDTVALRSRGYIPKRGPLAGPPGTLPNWFQGNPANWNAFNGPTSGYVSANFNCVTSGTQDLWLILPPVNTAAGDTISFYERSVAGNTFPDSTRVYYAANGDTVPGSGSFVELGKFLNSIGGAWVERRFVAPTAGANGRWAINYRVANGGPPGANGNLIGIDYIRILGPAPALNTTLLLVHDSTVVTTQARRKQDRDSMRAYLGGLVGSYDVMTFDTNTTLPSLTQYSRIIVQETAFDAIQCRYLGLGARNALIAWLNTGSPSAKKYLYNLGGDLGYNYSRANSGQDLNFSGTICGYTYRVDNAPGGPGTIVGVTIDVGNTRNIQTPGSNYYPDGCSISNGSLALYRYGNRTALDTLAALGRVTANYDVRSLFCDPSYFPSNFQVVLAALLGNSLVGITPVGNTIPQVYTLSQNYPNPFNPVTNIKFGIPQSGNVKLVVFDILGRQVATLVNEFKTSGNYVVDFNASYLASGAYFYRLEAGNFTETKKMLLVK